MSEKTEQPTDMQADTDETSQQRSEKLFHLQQDMARARGAN